MGKIKKRKTVYSKDHAEEFNSKVGWHYPELGDPSQVLRCFCRTSWAPCLTVCPEMAYSCVTSTVPAGRLAKRCFIKEAFQHCKKHCSGQTERKLSKIILTSFQSLWNNPFRFLVWILFLLNTWSFDDMSKFMGLFQLAQFLCFCKDWVRDKGRGPDLSVCRLEASFLARRLSA